MNNLFSVSTLKSVLDRLPEKLIASAATTSLTSALGIHAQLLAIFCILEILDVFTRWIAQACLLWGRMYPRTPGSVWVYIKFIPQAHRWRYINSNAMRTQFISKISTFCIILLFSSLCDVAMRIAGASAMALMLPLCTTVLSFTELLSCLENLAEANVDVAQDIMDIVKKRKEQIK